MSSAKAIRRLAGPLLLGVALAGSALTETAPRAAEDERPVAVHLRGLDLRDPAGARAAARRIRLAARDLCGDAPSLKVLDHGAAFDACVAATVDAAWAALRGPINYDFAAAGR